MRKHFCITEVFAEKPYGGNQLATVFGAADLPEDRFQPIARAFNFPETTFFMGGDLSAGFDVRIFTPVAELPFAGHPTLGSAWLAKRLFAPDARRIELNLGVGRIPVEFGDDGVLWMRQQPPTFGRQLEHAEVAARLGVGEDVLDADLPCELVSTGLEFLIIPVRSLDRLRALHPPSAAEWPMLMYCPESYESDQQIAARMFAPELGVAEDPATGSANGCLASYLLRHRVYGDHLDLRVGQGYEIARPSQLCLRASRDGEDYEINVGGRVRLAAEGDWIV